MIKDNIVLGKKVFNEYYWHHSLTTKQLESDVVDRLTDSITDEDSGFNLWYNPNYYYCYINMLRCYTK